MAAFPCLDLSGAGAGATSVTAGSYYNPIWRQWSNTYFTSITASTNSINGIWYNWQQSSSVNFANNYYTSLIYAQPITPAPTAEENKRAAERRRLRNERARELLLSVLDERQKIEFEQYKFFHVNGGRGNSYRITPGHSPTRVVNDRAVASYCIHPDACYHDDDVAAAIKLLIEVNEPQFLKTANATQLALAA